MENNTPTSKSTIDQIDQTFGSLDDERKAGLLRLQQIHSARLTGWQREKARLAPLVSADDSRLLMLSQRIAVQPHIVTGLQDVVTKADINLKPADDQVWEASGLVLNAERQGVPNLLIWVFDSQQRPIRWLGEVKTNAQGFFDLQYKPTSKADEEKWHLLAKETAYLGALDERHKILAMDTVPLQFKVGHREVHQLVLGKVEVVKPVVKAENKAATKKKAKRKT